MRAPEVTIGIPFYNPGAKLRFALQSVFAQTFRNWELLLVDDGSTDDSSGLASSINDERVRFSSDGKNLGLAGRLNQIVELARGEIIVRMDADDLMDPRRVEALLARMNSAGHPRIVSSGMLSLNQSLEIVGRSPRRHRDITHKEILRSGGIAHSTVAATKKWFSDNPYNEDYVRAEDRELFARAFKPDEFAYLDEPLYFYVHVGNVRPSAYLQSYRTERRVLKEYGPRVIGYPATGVLYGRSILKTLLLRATSCIGVQNSVFKHNYVPLEEQETAEAKKRLEAVLTTELPLMR